MEVTQVGVHLLNNPESRARAVVWIILNGEFRVNSIRVIEGRNGLFVAYPGENKKGTDQWFQIAYPVKPQLLDHISERVLLAYNEMRGMADGVKFAGLSHA